MIYAEYGYYTASYLGTAIAEADFNRLSRQASSYLDNLTMGRITAEWSSDDRVQDACCAVVEVMYKQEQGGEIASESNHNVSRTYVTSGKSAERRMYEAAALYLAPTGLLYRGLE